MITQTHDTTGAAGGLPSLLDDPMLKPVLAARSGPEGSGPPNQPPASAGSPSGDSRKPGIPAPHAEKSQPATAEGAKRAVDNFTQLWQDPSISMVEIQMAFSTLLQSLRKTLRALKRAEVQQVGEALKKAADESFEAAKLHRDSAVAQAVGEIVSGAMEMVTATLTSAHFGAAQSKAAKSQQKLDLLKDQLDAQKPKPDADGFQVMQKSGKAPQPSSNKDGVEISPGEKVEAAVADRKNSSDRLLKDAEAEVDRSEKMELAEPTAKGTEHTPSGSEISVATEAAKRVDTGADAAARMAKDKERFPGLTEQEISEIRNEPDARKLKDAVDAAKAQLDADKEEVSRLINGGMQMYNQMASAAGRVVSASSRLFSSQIDYQAAEWERRSKYTEADIDVIRGQREQYTDDEHEANTLAEQTKNRANDIIQNAYQTQLRIVTA